MSGGALSVSLADGRSLTAIRSAADPGASWTFIYAPGAGSNIHDPFGACLAQELPSRGIAVVRFQFPYQEAGRRSPDRPDLLESAWQAVIEALRPLEGRLAVGGRSMGGRIASMVVARHAVADALVLFAYPLHPPGRPEQRRDAHLADIAVPTLFCSGTNDSFASPGELRAAAAKVPRSTVCLLEAADHGFSTPKAGGRTRQDVWAEAAQVLTGWLAGI